jgi:hypothetical protein
LKALTSTEVFDALEAIGIGKKGKSGIQFAAEVQRDGPGWRAEVDLPKGVTADKVLEKRAELAAAMRRPISTVWPSADRSAHPGRLVLWIAQQDPAKAARRLWPRMAKGQADVFAPLPFGFDPRGNLVEMTLMYSNLLVGGIPGSGKTSCALAIVLGVALDRRPNCGSTSSRAPATSIRPSPSVTGTCPATTMRTCRPPSPACGPGSLSSGAARSSSSRCPPARHPRGAG